MTHNRNFAAEQREEMAMDSSLLYWDMKVSFLLHLVGPIAIATIFGGMLESYPLTTRVWILIIGSVIYSFIINFCVLLFLQTISCEGLKDTGGVVAGATISAALTGFFMWIPTIWEGLRLAISQIFVDHHSLMTAAESAREGVITAAAKRMMEIPDTLPIQKGGKRLTPKEYDNQTFNEIKSALTYMAAFAGAYGVGIGSRYAVKCK